MFTSAIYDSHPDLTNTENLKHLRTCLRDAALETIRSWEISDGNYAIALDLLQIRFDNRRLVFRANITEILEASQPPEALASASLNRVIEPSELPSNSTVLVSQELAMILCS